MNDELNASLDPNMSISDGNKTPPNFDFVTQRSKNRQNIAGTAEDCILSQLSDFKEEMRKLMTYFTASQKTEIADLKATLREIQQSNQNIETSVAFLTSQNEELKTQVAFLEKNVKEDGQYIMYLENKMEDLQGAIRKTNFQIKNVPKKTNESKQDLVEMVVCLAESLDCQLSRSDIKDIYRLRGNKPDHNNTPIIIETTSAILKTNVLKKAKLFNVQNKTKLCAKHLGFKTQEDTPIFLSEHLTAKGSRLHFLARDLAKSKGYRFCWTNYGKVYVRKSEQSPIVLIRSEEQVHHLLLDD